MPEHRVDLPPDEPAPSDALRARLTALCTEGWALSDKFGDEVRQHKFHPFVAADYEVVLDILIRHRRPGLRFLEWGSATGVITIMADMLGFDASGIELDSTLVATARTLAERFESGARFVSGSFIPNGYRWQPRDGDGRTGTLGTGPSGYLLLARSLDEFDVVFGYPWGGEEAMMIDLMGSYGRPGALLILHGADGVVRFYRAGRQVPA